MAKYRHARTVFTALTKERSRLLRRDMKHHIDREARPFAGDWVNGGLLAKARARTKEESDRLVRATQPYNITAAGTSACVTGNGALVVLRRPCCC